MKLTPVSGNPFESAQNDAPTLMPVEGNPFADDSSSDTDYEAEIKAYEDEGGGVLSSIEKGARRLYQGALGAAAKFSEASGANEIQDTMSAMYEEKTGRKLAPLIRPRESYKDEVSAQQEKIAELPTHPTMTRAYNEANKADGYVGAAGDFISEVIDSPDTTGFIIDQAAELAPQIVTMLFGAKGMDKVLPVALKGIKRQVATMAGAGYSSSFANTYGPNLAESIEKGFSFDQAEVRASLQSMTQGGVDALTAAVVPWKIGPNQFTNIPAQTFIQMIGGATGEIARSAVVGEEASQADVVVEGLLEALGLPGDIAANVLTRKKTDASPQLTPVDGNPFEPADQSPQTSPIRDIADQLSPKTAKLRDRILATREAKAQEQKIAQEREAAFAEREAAPVDDAQVREDMMMQQDQPRYLNKLQRDENRLPGKVDAGTETVEPFDVVSERPLDETAQQALNQEAPANNAMADALSPVADKMQGDNSRAARLPANLKDPRLAREDYRAPLQQMSDDLTKGGGIALVGGQFSEMNQDKPATQVDDPIRTSSINPEWFQNMTAPAVDGSAVDTGYSVKDTQRAVNKALEGKLLGKREIRVIEYMLDQVEADRTSPDNIDYARDTQAAVRQKIAKPLPRGEIAKLIADSPEINYEPGSRSDESAYNSEWDAETRSLADLAREAFELDPAGYDALVERTDSLSDYAIAQELIKFTKEPRNAAPQATQTEEQADAGDPRPTDRRREERLQTEDKDLLGDNTQAAQEVKDAAVAQDKKRSPNKDVPADQGIAGDLFSEQANNQVDIEDVVSKQSDTKPVVSPETENNILKTEPNQSTSINAQEIDKSPPDTTTKTPQQAASDEAVSDSGGQKKQKIDKAARKAIKDYRGEHRSLVDAPGFYSGWNDAKADKKENVKDLPESQWGAYDDGYTAYREHSGQIDFSDNETTSEAVSTSTAHEYDYSSSQVALDGDDMMRVRQTAKRLIDVNDIDPAEGLEERPHITVKYGLHTSDSTDLSKALQGEGKITATVDGVEIFENDENDVVVLRVSSPDLTRLNKKIADSLEHTDTFPDYKPHITLGYVKKGAGKKYAKIKTDLEGQVFTFNAVEFSGKDGGLTKIKMEGVQQPISKKKPDILTPVSKREEKPKAARPDVDVTVPVSKRETPKVNEDVNSDVDEFATNLEAELGLKSLHMFSSKGDLKLQTIIVEKDKRKQGVGTQAMERIVEYADEKGFRVILTPAVRDDFQGVTSRSRLVKFYKRFGFVENKGRNKDFTISESMYRESVVGDGKTDSLVTVSKREKVAVDSLSSFDDFKSRLYDGKVKADEFKSAFESVVANKDSILSEISSMTKPGIFKRFSGLEYRYKSEKKDRVIGAAFDRITDEFNLSDSVSFMIGGGNYEESRLNSIRQSVEKATDESITEHFDEIIKARDERNKEFEAAKLGAENPEKLEDYIRNVRIKMAEGATFQDARMTLSPEQRATFDTLLAEKTRSERGAKKAEDRTRVGSAGATTDTEIIETKHTRDDYDLFVVQTAERVDRDIYKEWLSAAKKMGGWYSRFRGTGAVPGFQFKTRESAEAFQKYVSAGDTDAVQEQAKVRRDAFEDDRSQSAVERLNEMADRLEGRADESLGQERKVNTSRRAGMAARAEASASYDKAMSETMRNIAAAIESGKAKFLDRVRQKTQVEMMSTFVNLAKDEQIRNKFPEYRDQVKRKGEAPDAETADFATWPTYTAFRSDLARLGRQAQETEGMKLIGQKILKVADDVTKEYLKFAKENLNKVSTFSTKSGDRAAFKSKAAATEAIRRSGYRGQAIVLPFKRGENLIILSPSEAQKRGIWDGDDDKRITLNPEFVEKLIGKARRKNNLTVPWQFESVYEKRKRLDSMGLETPAEFRSALREFVALREAPAEPDKIKEMERKMIGRAKDGLDFFPTPESVADEMVEIAQIEPGMTVLEPSAGMGHIAERIREAGVEPDVVEFSSSRRELLEAKGLNIVGNDFMDVTDGDYDRIIMNPPFSDRRDAEHVQHAYDQLKPGGRIVAIMGEGVFFGKDKTAAAFREWLESVGGTEEKLPEGSFQDTSLPVNTGTNARMVVIEKSADIGEAKLSRAKKKSTPLAAVELDAVIDRVAPFLKGADGVTVVDTFRDLPAAIQDDAKKQDAGDGDVEGVFHKGKVYLVRDAIVSEEHAETVLLHELTHRGMDVIYGNKGVNAAMRKLYMAMGSSKGLNRIAKDLGIDLKPYREGLSSTFPDGTQRYSKEQRANILVEEVIAHQGELKPSIQKRIRELIGAIKEWLRSHGLTKLASKYGANDIAYMAKKAREAGSGKASKRGATRFMATGASESESESVSMFSRKSEEDATNALPEESRAQQIWDTLVFKAQDKFAPLLKVQRQAEKKQGVDELLEDQDAYLAELRYHGMTGAKIEDFHEDHIQPLLEAIHKADLSLEEIGEVLHARHAPEANAQLKKINPDREDNEALSGMSNEEAVQVIKDFKERGQLDALEDIASRVDIITKARRDLLRESGLEANETIDAWENAYKYYIPLQREGKGKGMPRKGKGFDTRGKSKRRTGSNLDVANVLAQVVAQYEATVIRSEKAKVGKALLDFVKANPDEKLYTIDKPDYKATFDKDGLVVYRPDTSYILADNVLSVRIDGEEHHITFNEKSVDAMRIARSMKNLGAQDAGVIVNALLKVNRWLALVNTSANPEFVISNFARDMQTAGYNLNDTEAANMKKAIFKDVGKAWRGIRSAQKGKLDQAWAKHFREFRDAGGKTGWMDHYRDIDQRETKLKKLLREMQPGKIMTIKRGLNNLMKFIEDENTAVENAVRLSTFVHARKAGISEAKAARIAKELTVNFNRKGDSGQVLNALYLFYNASIQGSVRLIIAARKSSKVRKMMLGTVAFAVMLDMLNRSLGGDDDDGEPRYDKIPDYTKAHNLIVMRPGGDYFKIPLPWGYNVMHVTGQVLGEAMSKKGFKSTDGAMRVLSSVMGAFNPIGGEESILQMVSPTITDPFIQWGTNKDFAGRPLRPADNPFGVDKPNSQKYWGSVREPSRYITEQLNSLTGGDAVRPGAVDISPEFFDLMYDTVTGGAGRFLGDTVATPIKILQKEEIETYTVPLVRKLYGTQNPRRMVSSYYKNMEDIRLVENQIKFYREDPEKRRSVKDEFNAQYRLIGRAKQYQSQIRKLRKRRNQIKNTKKLTDQERKLKLQPIEDRINLVMTKFNKLYREKVVMP